MDVMKQISETLQTNGGWGLAALLLFVIWQFLKYIRGQHKERIEEQKASIELLEGIKNALGRNEKALDRFTEKLDRLLSERRA
jgi:hypothetical protein